MDRPDYDSFVDEPDTERGYGWAIGGSGRRQTVRARRRWRVTAAHHAKLTALDLVTAALPEVLAVLCWLWRSHVALAQAVFVLAALSVLWAGLWFRTQRMQHTAKRGPGAF